MVYKAVTVHSFAALPVNVITSLVLNKYAKKCFEEKKEMTGQDIVDYALKETVCASGTPFGRRDACYLIANNPEEAVKTCADIRSSGDNGEIRRTNPFQNPKAFAARMLQGSLEDAVRDYAEIRGVSMEDKISPVFFALAHDRYSGTAELGLDAKEKVYIPSDSSVDFNTRVIYAYPEVCRMLAKAEDGSRFDDVVYSADANPSAAGVFGGIARKASLWTCLTQDAPIISKMYMDAMLKGGTDFCREMGNPIANIRLSSPRISLTGCSSRLAPTLWRTGFTEQQSGMTVIISSLLSQGTCSLLSRRKTRKGTAFPRSWTLRRRGSTKCRNLTL